MILIDANLLIYAVNADSPHHARARPWIESALSGTEPVGLAWVVLLAFIRITTRSGIFQNPLTAEEALAYVEEWLAQPYVVTVVPGDGHWSILQGLLKATGSAGNLTSDAHLAALAIEHRCPVYSTDADFGRFTGVEYRNPLALEA